MEEPALPTGRAERSAMEWLVFTLKEGFEFGEMMRRTRENVLAEMLEKVLAYNISQIIRVRSLLWLRAATAPLFQQVLLIPVKGSSSRCRQGFRNRPHNLQKETLSHTAASTASIAPTHSAALTSLFSNHFEKLCLTNST